MATIAAVLLMAWAAARLVPRLPGRGVVVMATTVALLCGGYEFLSARSPRKRLEQPRRFDDEHGGKLRVEEDEVLAPRATPRALVELSGMLAAAATLGAALARRRRPRPAHRRRLPSVKAMGLLAAVGAPFALTFAGALRSPPRGYDALWYHLPAAIAFARNHHLEPPGRDLVFYFPANLELTARMFFDAFGARALALVQWPFALGAAVAAIHLARALGFRRQSVLAGALVLAAPMVLFQSQLAYADVYALFATTVAALLLVRAARVPTWSRALPPAALGGLALGIVLGAKYAALPLVVALAPVLFLWSCAPAGRLGLRHVPRALAVCTVAALGTLPPAWFWYARNLRLTGNPFFPISVPALGLRGLLGSTAFNPGKEFELVSARWQWAVYPWIERTSHESGFGAAFATLVPVALGVLTVVALRRVRRGRLPAFAFPLAWGALYLVAWWVGTPHEARHLLPLVVLFGAPAVGLLPQLDGGRGGPALAAVLVALLFSTVSSLRTLLYAPTPDVSARARSAEELYDLPPALVAQIPDWATVANRAGRPYNLPLLGPRLTWKVDEFAPRWPTLPDLHDHHVQYLVYRGPAGEVPLSSLRLLYQQPVHNLGWWDTRPGDVLALYEVP